MKRFYLRNINIFQVLLILIVWRIYLLIIQSIAFLYPLRLGYLGFIPEANFDGVFYINISEYWYRGLDQAFFPFYPFLMKLITFPTSISPAASGLIISISSLIILIYTLKKIMKLDKFSNQDIWIILILLSFPTAFFLSLVYTESLFLTLVILSFYFTRKHKLFVAVFFAILASATRIVGIFLLPVLLYEVYLQLKEKEKKVNLIKVFKTGWILLLTPVGLLSYMGFLWYKYLDPFLFVHIQPAFGAGRSGGEIVLLPQVLYRYLKIFTSIPLSSQLFFISMFEFVVFIFFSIILLLSIKKKIRKSYILFSFLALYFPTLSGTLSSIPRYALVCFAVFIYLGTLKNKYIKVALISIGLIFQSIFAILFYRGYFVA